VRNRIKLYRLGILLLGGLACNLISPPPTPTLPSPTAPPAIPSPTVPATPDVPPTEPPTSPTAPLEPTASPEPTPTNPPRQSFIAYVVDGQLLVTDVTGGVKGGTTQYTLPGVDDQVTDLAWSPSGEFIAYTSAASGTPHVFYIYAIGASTPADLGPGSNPAWASDSRSLVYIRDDNLWTTSVYESSPTQITFETDWAWGQPVFTPDGSAVLAGNAARINMGAQGNTQFFIEQIPLDGSGTHTPLPGMTQTVDGRLPYDLRFSPDGQHLAFSTSFHESACSSPASYYVLAPDGSNPQTILSPEIAAALDPAREISLRGHSYAWSPASDALAITGGAWDCANRDSPKYVAGPMLSVMGLDGVERLSIPGDFFSPTFDYSGQMLAAALVSPDGSSQVRVYSLAGDVLLELGPGTLTEFQP
jgi:Tol biopolymer transport system component